MSDGFVTVAQCVEGLPVGRFVWELLACGFLCWFLLGAINESTPFAFSFVSTDWASNEHTASAMSEALALGNFLAVLAGGWIADTFGRMAVIRPALLMTIASGMILQMARTFYQAVVARFVLGLVSGGLLGVMPPLIAELLPSRNRGFYLTIWCCGWPAGALFSVTVGCLLPSLNWRAFYTITLVPAMILYICSKADMLPESPRYLYLAGRCDEGYNILLDMYEKEQLPMPWAAETVAVTCSPAKSTSSADGFAVQTPSRSGAQSPAVVVILLALAMFCVSAAAQSMKLWMPTMLVAQEVDGLTNAHNAAMPHPSIVGPPFGFRWGRVGFPAGSGYPFAGGPAATSLLSFVHAPLMLPEPNYKVVLVLTQAYIVELVGIIIAAYISTWVHRKQMVQWSLLFAALFTLLALAAAEKGAVFLCGPLVGLQLATQATGFNFLQVFASEYFPTSRRAKTCAVVNFAAQLGNFTIPVLGGWVVQRVSPSGAVVFFSALYVVGWIITLRLPLPTSREQPLHDVDEPRSQKAPGKSRKREWMSYQTI